MARCAGERAGAARRQETGRAKCWCSGGCVGCGGLARGGWVAEKEGGYVWRWFTRG